VRVLGVDPGLSRCGVAVVEGTRRRAAAVRAGVIRTPPDEAVPRRLRTIHAELVRLIDETGPDAVAVERVFFSANVRTAMGVGQAAGVVMLAAAQAGLDVHEYTPTRMKAVVTGVGNADKAQVAFMVRTHLRLAEAPSPPDTADALALALCHLWESHGQRAGAGMSPRLAAAVQASGPGAQVVSRGAGPRHPDGPDRRSGRAGA
jgi:crossover junction endodeoxyribonuclease RuvC